MSNLKAFMTGGPRNGYVIPFTPFQDEYRFPIPRELTVQDCLQQAYDPSKIAPNYDVALYRNTYRATVDAAGRVGCVIYEFAGMDPA